MPASASPLDRNLLWQILLACVGSAAFCVYSRSWKDWAHLVYDIPASLLVFSFIAQLVLEARHAGSVYWLARFALLVAMTVVCTGRDFLHWPISGHLSCVLAVALVQAWDLRLPFAERLLVWLPLPIVLVIRWWLFDQGQHGQTYRALLFAVLAALPVVLAGRQKKLQDRQISC
jgi:hypothetical protein